MNLQKLETCLRQCDVDWAELRHELKCKEYVIRVIAEGGFPLLLRLFHAAGFELGQKIDGWAPMHYAAENGHAESIRVLHELGADVNEADELSRMPMHYAAEKGHAEVIRVLHELGASVNVSDRSERTPMHYAA